MRSPTASPISPSASATSTGSRRSTTSTGTAPGTTSSSRWPSGSRARCGPATSSPASAATSSPSCGGPSPTSAVLQVAQRLLAAMHAPFDVPGGTVQLGLSIGIALARPRQSAEALLAAADAALYDSKRRGGGASTIAG